MEVVPAKVVEIADVPGFTKTVVTRSMAVQNGVVSGRKCHKMVKAEFVFVGNTACTDPKPSQNQQEIDHFLENGVHKWTLFLEKTRVIIVENDQKPRKKPGLISMISTRIQGLGLDSGVEIGAIWVHFDPKSRVLRVPKVQFLLYFLMYFGPKVTLGDL